MRKTTQQKRETKEEKQQKCALTAPACVCGVCVCVCVCVFMYCVYLSLITVYHTGANYF